VTANAVTTRLLHTTGLATVGSNLSVGTFTNVGSNLSVATSATVGTTLNVAGNTTVGNLNTANAVTAGILVATNRADIGQLSAGATTLTSGEITGSLVVGGNFTIQGQTLLDTDTIKLRATTKQTIGAGVGTGFVINRANSAATLNGTTDTITSNGHGFINGQNVAFISLSTGVTGLSNNTIFRVVQKTDNTFKVASVGAFPTAIDFSTLSGATATVRDIDNPDGQIRWNEVNRYWDIRDVLNSVDATSYSKILTANLISNSLTSTSAETVLSSQGANILDGRIVTANTNLKNYTDNLVSTANTNLKNYVDTANTNLKNYTDNLVSTANTNLKNYTDNLVSTANTNLKNYTDNLVSTANTNLKNYVDVENLKPVTVLAPNVANTTSSVTLATFRANTAGANLHNLVVQHIRETAGSNTEGTLDRISRQTGAAGTTIQGHIKLRDSTVALHALGKHPVALAPDSSTGDSFAVDYYGRVHVGVPLANTTPTKALNISTTSPSIGFLDSLTGLNATSRYSYIDANDGNLAFFADTFQSQADSAITFAVDTSTTAVRISPSGTAATSTATGTMVVTGGVGISGAAVVGGNLSVAGDLLVSGTTTTINTAQLNIADNEFVLNSDLPNNVAPTENSGFIVNRGSSTNTYIRWNETTDTWVANNGITAGEFRLANTTTYLNEGTNLYLTAARVRANVGNTAPILYDSSNGVFSHATSGVTAARHGSSTNVPVFTVNAEGHVTAVTNTAIAFPAEADTLSSVVSRGNNTTSGIDVGSLRIGSTAVINSSGQWVGSNSGLVGAQGVQGAVGAQGPQGFQGAVGAQGVQGAVGAQGVQGAVGAQGVQGAVGAQGFQGVIGAQGAVGAQGAQGFQGVIGAQGAAGGFTTNSNAQVNSLGVGTAASGAQGEIRATGDITAYFSDDRLKNRLEDIENGLDKVIQLSGFYYEANEIAQQLGYTIKREVGVSAQEVQKVLPEVIAPAPIDEQYLTVKYERIVPLLIMAIKELKQQVDDIKNQLNNQ
jgi:hypothetical protein